MKIQCQLIQDQWESYRKGKSPNSKVIREMKNHLTTCPACREFAYKYSLSPLLKESYGEDAPEPSKRFFDNLAKKLDKVEYHTQEITSIEILLQRGWKLVPTMAAILILLTGFLVYHYKNLSTMRTPLPPIEEVILFDDAPLNEYYVLSAITTEVGDNEQ